MQSHDFPLTMITQLTAKKYKQLLQTKKEFYFLPLAAVSCKRKIWRGAPF